MKKTLTLILVTLCLTASSQWFDNYVNAQTIINAPNLEQVASGIPTDGLVNQYTFSGNANDVVGGQNGTVYGATLTTGLDGSSNSAYLFTNNSDYIDLGGSVGDYTDNFTLSGWIKTSSSSGRILLSRRGAQTQYDIYISTVIKIYTGTVYSGVSNISDGSWHHVAIVINGASSQIYVDGATDGSTFSPTITSRTLNTNVNNWGDGTSSANNGSVDEILVYNKALSITEVQQIYNAQKSL